MTNMDVLLRCPICKNYLKDPVVLSLCSHNFCSECIRRSLLHKHECPICRHQALRSHLVHNKIINQLLNAYKLQIKDKIDDMDIDKKPIPKNKKSKSIQCNLSSSLPSISSNNNNNKNINMNLQINHKPKRKKINIESFMNPIIKKQNKTNSKKRKLNILDQDSDISVFEPPKNRRKLNHKTVQNGNYVNCPICGKMVIKSFINGHIDQCLNGKPMTKPDDIDIDIDIDIDLNDNEEKTAIIRTKTDCPIKLIAYPAYSHITQKDLKKLLEKLRLNTSGDKKLMIKRHREFVLRHNAQIDAYLNDNDTMNDREIAREINNGESKQIHCKFFNKSNICSNNKRNREKRKNQRDELYKKLIKDLKKRMGNEWCRKRRIFRKKRLKMRKQDNKQMTDSGI